MEGGEWNGGGWSNSGHLLLGLLDGCVVWSRWARRGSYEEKREPAGLNTPGSQVRRYKYGEIPHRTSTIAHQCWQQRAGWWLGFTEFHQTTIRHNQLGLPAPLITSNCASSEVVAPALKGFTTKEILLFSKMEVLLDIMKCFLLPDISNQCFPPVLARCVLTKCYHYSWKAFCSLKKPNEKKTRKQLL